MATDDHTLLPCPTPSSPLRLGRRGVLAFGAAMAVCRGAAASQAGYPATDSLNFQVSRNGAPIGTHKLEFSRAGRDLTVHIDAAFRVGFGFITFYRYHHVGVERWRDGHFDSLETTTNDNGREFQVLARRTPGGVTIQATGVPDQTVAEDTLPLTHWAMAAMTAPLFNPETGKMLRETVRPRGAKMIDLANGTSIKATGFTLKGDAPIEDWYDDSQVWAALDAVGQDGSRISYRRA